VFRSPVLVRDAGPDDVDDLLELWTVRGSERTLASPVRSDALASAAGVAADPDQRLLVAVVDDRVAGAAHLVRAPVSPIHSDSAVYVLHLQVLDRFRRHGAGRSLMEAAVTWAEEKDSTHVVAAASAGSRDANRFMARLGLGPTAMVRAATVASMRAKLPLEPPAVARVGTRSHRNVGQVIVQRRSLRRARDRTS
jgi:GNAT superfamily N-acetyltransferase